MGGGGYDLSAVIRGWAMAYGAMLHRTWPNRIPKEFQERVGLTDLQDLDPPHVDAGLLRNVQRQVEEVVIQVHRLVFPTHGLSGLA